MTNMFIRLLDPSIILIYHSNLSETFSVHDDKG